MTAKIIKLSPEASQMWLFKESKTWLLIYTSVFPGSYDEPFNHWQSDGGCAKG